VITKTVAGFKVSLGYGVIDKLHPKGHTGIDIALPEGSPLYSVGNGIVEKVVDYGDVNSGKTVILQLNNGDRIVYGHLSEPNVHPGDIVIPGELVAFSGNTGRSTGPHLHLSAKQGNTPHDPSQYVESALQPTNNNPFIPDFIENPYKDTAHSINQLNENIQNFQDGFTYWVNPKNWFIEGWQGLEHLIHDPGTAVVLIAGTIIGGWLIACGVKWPKKIIFWSWVGYWILRGFVFV
jgi:hypothetical protein